MGIKKNDKILLLHLYYTIPTCIKTSDIQCIVTKYKIL